MNDPAIFRMIDANANRAREALRVMEDYVRFGVNDSQISAQLKQIRHALGAVLSSPPLADAIAARDTDHDVGTENKTASEFSRESIGSIVIAAGKRLSESLRVLEECTKTIDPSLALSLERLRYRGYVIEQTLTRFVGNDDARARFSSVKLYVLLTDSLCHPSVNGWENTLDQILAAARANAGCHASAPASGAEACRLCIQLREKSLPDHELLRRAKILAQKCRHAGAISIINDRPDIALLANADGIHLGQDDLPCTEARKLLGPQKIIGISTENLTQARQAIQDGATYLALGPMFPTTTKAKARLAGPAYAAQAASELPKEIPLVAIGGIHTENMSEITSAGVPRICVCSAIISQPNPAAAAANFMRQLNPTPIEQRP